MSCTRLVPGSGWFTCDVLFCYDHRGAGGLVLFFFFCFRMDTWFSIDYYSLARPSELGFFLLTCLHDDSPRYQLGCVFCCLMFSYAFFLRVRASEKVRSRHSFLPISLWPWHDMKGICQSLIFLIYTYCLIHGLPTIDWPIKLVVLHCCRMIHCRMIVWSTPSRNTPETRKGFGSTRRYVLTSRQPDPGVAVRVGIGGVGWNPHASWHLGLVFRCVGWVWGVCRCMRFNTEYSMQRAACSMYICGR